MSKYSRNEAARARHRQRKKEECGCMSVPSSAIASEDSSYISLVKLNESNHYGWSVCGKFAEDPEFERLLQYHGKPELPEIPDDQQSTYVLCMQDRSAPPEEECITCKATQTSRQHLDDDHKKEKKKNLISEFLYRPITERTRSRSPSTGRSKLKTLGLLIDEPRMVLKGGIKQNNKNNKKLHGDDQKGTTDFDERSNKIGDRKDDSRKDIDKQENIVAARQTASEAKQRQFDKNKKMPKKIGSKQFSYDSNKSIHSEYNKMNKPSVTFHMNPVKSKLSSSEHLIRTEDLRRKNRR